MTRVLANLAIALGFMALTGFWSVPGFLAGLGLGFVIVALAPVRMQPGAKPRPSYGARVFLMLVLVGMFLRELLLSALRVARLVTRRHMVMNSGIFAFPLTVTRDFEITLLANLITLTPGTLSVDVSPDRKILYVHAIDSADPDTARKEIAEGFERAILEAFR